MKATAQVKEQARALLSRLTVKNVFTKEHRRGVFWTADLCLDGKLLLKVEQAGNGGSNDYLPLKGQTMAHMRATLLILEGACTVLGLGEREPLDMLTAAMEEGKIGLDALKVALETLAELEGLTEEKPYSNP